MVALLPVLAVVSVNAIGFLCYRQTPGSDILNQRIAELERTPPVDVVLLGDSTLNAAIDEGLLAGLSKKRVRCLGLTGLWGYGGALALLERLLERQTPSTVVLMHTPDTLGRETSDFGYFLASPHARADLLADRYIRRAVRDNLISAKNFKKWWKAFKRQSEHRERPSVRDAIFNQPTLQPYIRENLQVAAVNPAKSKYLERLASLCAAHGLRCLYAHGPLARPLLDPVRPFLDQANAVIDHSGVERLPFTPMPMDYPEVGDTEDHVAASEQAAFTRRFAARLLPYLDGESPPLLARRQVQPAAAGRPEAKRVE